MNYRIEWIGPVAGIGALTLLMVPVFGPMLALAVVGIVGVAIVLALVGAIVAMPFLVARAVRRHRRSGRARPAYVAQAEAPAPVR
jgi:hypothetical protein